MKTLLFCTSYINNSKPDHHQKRYEKWVSFYKNLMQDLNADYLFMIDDGSQAFDFGNDIKILSPENLPETLINQVNLIHFDSNLGRSSISDYQGWYRSFIFSLTLAEKYEIDKIIHIESDFYILTPNMVQYFRDKQSGWTAFYCRAFKFPETAMQIICKDSFEDFKTFRHKCEQNNYKFTDIAENLLPFTHIEKSFLGDRFGEPDVLLKWKKRINRPFQSRFFGKTAHSKLWFFRLFSPLTIDYFGQMAIHDDLKNYKKWFR